MPESLAALVAFVSEDQRCGELDGGREGGYVWLACSCGAQIMHPVSASPPAPARTYYRRYAIMDEAMLKEGFEMLRMRETMRWTTLILPLVVVGLSVTGCAAIRAHQTAETEQILAAAGFQVKPADTPEKLAHLQTLTPRKVVRYTRNGRPQYVYADPETCNACT